MKDLFNVPIALIFFTRPKTFAKVFEQVKKVRPKQLFLIQDGARANSPDDLEKIEACRKIAEDIDWECEVYKNYSEVNLGCGVRPSSGISWVFEHVDRAIILEDDCVPCESFFPYCEEMLEKYKDDERVAYVSGLNHFGEWDCGDYSYFFAKTGAIAAWATWKRAWQRYDFRVNAIKDEYLKRIIKYQITDKNAAKIRFNNWVKVSQKMEEDTSLSYWDMQWGLVKYSQNQLVIVPKYNQICNIGVGSDSSHAQGMNDVKFVKYKNFVFIPTKNLELPIVHQRYCICDTEYDNLLYKCMYGSSLIKKIKKPVKKILKPLLKRRKK